MFQLQHSPLAPSGKQQNLATRLFQLAADTQRVGLHQEASVLEAVAASVLEGRTITVRDA